MPKVTGAFLDTRLNVNFTPEETMKVHRRYVGLGGQRHASATLPPRKETRYLYSRLGGPQGRSGVPRNFFSGVGSGSTNSVEDRENGDLGAVAP
jgi:hypothetical protein